MPLTPGTRLGAYEVVSAIGAGGMGEVYRAHDTSLGRDVAIKVLPDLFAADAERLARFEREARVLASLSHPNIASIYGLERSASVTCLVIELAIGETLAARIARGRVPVDDAVAIAVQIAAALEAAHDKGIVHRDLKPANVVVSPDGKVKVLDFGLAKLADGEAGGAGRAGQAGMADLSMSPTMAHAGTIAGVILGTAAYMSPEQARGKAVDKRADIWAFGCVLFEMLTGAPAFPGETLTDIVAAVMKNEPEWRALPADTPPPIRSVLRRCLAKDPARRFHDIADARIELEEPAVSDALDRRSVPTPITWRLWMQALPWTIALAAAAAAAWLSVRQSAGRDAGIAVARVEISPPPGVELYGGVSGTNISMAPDGRTFAFVGVRGGTRQIYLRRLDQFDATPLRGTESSFSCFFSPSGDAIGFAGTNGSLRRVSLADGLVQTLVPSDVDNTGSQVWGEDDVITFNRGGALWRVPGSGGEAKALTSFDRDSGELAHQFPAPVGRTAILFTALNASRPPRIEAISTDGGARRVVLESAMYPMPGAPGRLIFFRDDGLLAMPFDARTLTASGVPVRVVEHVGVGSVGGPIAGMSQAGSLIYATGTTAASTMMWVSRGGTQQPVTEVRRQYFGPRISPDGRRIVVQAGADLWIHDIERATFTRLTTPATFGNSFPIWTPDARSVVFRTSTGLHVIEVDRSAAARRIPDTTSIDFPTSVSPDGTTLLSVRQTADASQDVYATPLDGKGTPRRFISTPAFEGGGSFSPDGRWVAYVSDESGQMQVYVRPVQAERRWQVSTEGGTSPVWNRNGRELFYRNGNKLMVVAVGSGAELSLSPPHVMFEHGYTYGATITIPNFDVAPDGQRFVAVQDEPGAGRLAVVLNFFEDLRRAVTQP